MVRRTTAGVFTPSDLVCRGCCAAIGYLSEFCAAGRQPAASKRANLVGLRHGLAHDVSMLMAMMKVWVDSVASSRGRRSR